MKRSPCFLLLIGSLFFLNQGCATWSNRTKTIVASVGSGVVAGTVAACLAPPDEHAFAHGLIWGGPTAAGVALASLFVFDEQARSEEKSRQISVLEKELDNFRGEGGSSQPTLLYETSAPLGEEVPGEYRKLVSPGRWSVYRLNQWITQGENTLIHQDRMLKLIPAAFNPKKNEIETETK